MNMAHNVPYSFIESLFLNSLGMRVSKTKALTSLPNVSASIGVCKKSLAKIKCIEVAK